jgi:RimJ/RimL family protein N-acetyltransferase
MRLEIEEFDPNTAPESDLRGYYEVTKAIYTHDGSVLAIPSFESIVAQMRLRTWFLGRRRFWLARRNGRVVGLTLVNLPEAENTGQAEVEIRVLPDERRQGVGTALLRAFLPAAADEGRHFVSGHVRAGGDGEKWAAALGFAKVSQVIDQELVIAEVDARRWHVPTPAGYAARRWIGAAPQELVASFARARGAISDAPKGDSSYQDPDWTVERVRNAETEAAERGSEVRVVVAVARAHGEVVALTELELPRIRPNAGFQLDTAVVPAHRGHGLGRFIKAEMLRWLTVERPAIERIVTSNAADNAHMIRINDEIGFTTAMVLADVEAGVPALRARLAA